MFYRFLLEIPTLTLFARNDVFSLFHLYRHCEKGFSPTWQAIHHQMRFPRSLRSLGMTRVFFIRF